MLVACGGPGGGPLSSSQAEDACQDVCDRNVMCNGAALAECLADCNDEIRLFRGDVITDFIDCAVDLACTEDEDQCLECEPTGVHRDYEDRCREQLATCLTADELADLCTVEPAGPQFDGPGFICVVNTEVVGDLTDCLDNPDCASRLTCMQAVIAPFNNN